MKRLYLIVIAAVISGMVMAGLTAQPAAAHVLEEDNGISAVLHMPPDDVPVAGRPTTINLAFAASDPQFDIKEYRINVRLLRDDSAVAEGQLQASAGSSRNGTTSLTFPERGAYRLEVRGEPRNRSEGAGFKLGYSIRAVASDGSEPSAWQQAGIDFWAISIGSLALLAIIARHFIRRGGRYS